MLPSAVQKRTRLEAQAIDQVAIIDAPGASSRTHTSVLYPLKLQHLLPTKKAEYSVMMQMDR